LEIILVEDGSTDGSWKEIESCGSGEPRVKGIKLSRNFGQHYAITAGLEAARGQYVVVMDCDLQDDPVYIPELYRTAKLGNDVVLAIREKRKFPFWKETLTKLFYWVFSWLTDRRDRKFDGGIGAFSLLSRKSVDAFLKVREYHRFYVLVLRWIGFSTAYVRVEHKARPHGKSAYNLRRLVAHALNGIVSQSDKILYLAVKLGFAMACASVISILALITRYFLYGLKEGWTSMMVLMLLSTGLILFFLGVTGIYIGKIYEQSKQRPLYLVDKTINL
jgi:polyisoprenyl-phosphate glycosyltransferase